MTFFTREPTGSKNVHVHSIRGVNSIMTNRNPNFQYKIVCHVEFNYVTKRSVRWCIRYTSQNVNGRIDKSRYFVKTQTNLPTREPLHYVSANETNAREKTRRLKIITRIIANGVKMLNN